MDNIPDMIAVYLRFMLQASFSYKCTSAFWDLFNRSHWQKTKNNSEPQNQFVVSNAVQ